MSFLLKLLASGFGLGYAPVLSGTLGTLLGIPIFLGLAPLNPFYYFLTVTAFTFLSIFISNQALPLFAASKKAGDPSQIVIDEVAGFLWAAGIVRYAGFWDPSEGLLWLIAVPFLFFRIFDASKWWIVGLVERRFHTGGLGIVLDDIVAGILAGIASIFFCIVYPFIAYFFAAL
ncbi:MAG: phosphatidylglycerophosphatase A [Deltaproteobacteria bacterium]|nr:phosphatidylglycerophosphatase A [Deltaproteobacteria bacterium]